jgi:hypothetical protein
VPVIFLAPEFIHADKGVGIFLLEPVPLPEIVHFRVGGKEILIRAGRFHVVKHEPRKSNLISSMA